MFSEISETFAKSLTVYKPVVANCLNPITGYHWLSRYLVPEMFYRPVKKIKRPDQFCGKMARPVKPEK